MTCSFDVIELVRPFRCKLSMLRTVDRLGTCLVLALLLYRSAAGLAEAKPLGSPESNVAALPACMQTARTQYELNVCAEGLATESDKMLNKFYQAVLRYFCPEDSDRAQLVTAERAWIAFRDADCAFWGGEGGSIAPMNEAMCRADRSRERARELDEWPPNAPRSAMVLPKCK